MTYEQDWLNIYKDKVKQLRHHEKIAKELRNQIRELWANRPDNMEILGKPAAHTLLGDCIIISTKPYADGSVRILIKDDEEPDGTTSTSTLVALTDLDIKGI